MDVAHRGGLLAQATGGDLGRAWSELRCSGTTTWATSLPSCSRRVQAVGLGRPRSARRRRSRRVDPLPHRVTPARRERFAGRGRGTSSSGRAGGAAEAPDGVAVLMLSEASTSWRDAADHRCSPPRPTGGGRSPIPAGAFNVAAQHRRRGEVDSHPASSRVHLHGGRWVQLRRPDREPSERSEDRRHHRARRPGRPAGRVRPPPISLHGRPSRRAGGRRSGRRGRRRMFLAARFRTTKSVFAKTSTRSNRELVAMVRGHWRPPARSGSAGIRATRCGQPFADRPSAAGPVSRPSGMRRTLQFGPKNGLTPGASRPSRPTMPVCQPRLRASARPAHHAPMTAARGRDADTVPEHVGPDHPRNTSGATELPQYRRGELGEEVVSELGPGRDAHPGRRAGSVWVVEIKGVAVPAAFATRATRADDARLRGFSRRRRRNRLR
jgi:hypothetical protein